MKILVVLFGQSFVHIAKLCDGGLCHQPASTLSQQCDATPGLHISCAGRGPADQNVNTCQFYQVLFMQGLSSRSVPNIYLNRVSLQTVPWP